MPAEASCIWATQYSLLAHCCCYPRGLSFCLGTANHACHPARPRVSPPPFLLPRQGKPEEFVPYLSPDARGLPGPPPLDRAPLQLPLSADPGQLRAGSLVTVPDGLLVLEQGPAGLQHRGLAEELVSEGHLQQAREPGLHFPGPCLPHVSVCVCAVLLLLCHVFEM